MKELSFLFWRTTALLLLLPAEQSSGSFFSSLQFTRDVLMDFSRGSQQTVVINLGSKNITKTVNKTYKMIGAESITKYTPFKLVEVKEKGGTNSDNKTVRNVYSTVPSKNVKNFLEPSMRKDLPKQLLMKWQSKKNGKLATLILIPFNETVVANQTKRETYRPRSSPSNKFMKAINDIELAQTNANASQVKYSDATLAQLKLLVERAILSKSYKYARQVVGQIMYLLSTKAVSPGRTKRSSTSEGSKFLRDIRQNVGAANFDSFLAVQGDVALMFAIDDTGSMSEEIEAAKNIAKDIINYKRKVPIKEYILSPFNDPYPYPRKADPVTIKSETEAGEFVKEIDKLRAHAGGDCPEYTFHGMRAALSKLSIDRSPMYVFTDAGPKDATELDIEEVKLMASDYDVVINFLTTGYCRGRGYSQLDPRNLHPAFIDLAKSTSGLVIVFNSKEELEQVSNLTIGTLEGDSIVGAGSTGDGRRKRSAVRSTDSQYTIPVDDSIEKISVTINTATEGRGITLQDSENVEITSGKRSLSHITIYEINNPKKGAWTLTIPSSNGEHEYFVKSNSDSNVDFEHYFLIGLSWRRGHTAQVPISNPVTGKLNKIVITVAGSEKLDNSSLRLQLITIEGNHIKDISLQPESQGRFIASFNPDALVRSFKLKLKGTTQKGYPFERISRKTIRPTTAVLRSKYASNYYSLPLRRITFIHFQLCNFGTSEIFEVAAVRDRLHYVLPRHLKHKRVIKGRCATISVYARATRSEDVGKTDAVFIILKGKISRAIISQTVHLLVDN